MPELFSQSGMSEDVAIPPPALQGVFIPGLDKKDMVDGFGMVIPLGGGSSSRSYLDYGTSGGASAYNTFLSDLSMSLFPSVGGDISYNLEGLTGPQGPPGPAGPQGLPGAAMMLYSPPNGLFALSSVLQNFELLGTDVDMMIYTSAITWYGDFGWAKNTPGNLTSVDWRNLAGDSDLSFLIVSAFPGDVWISSDYGVTWEQKLVGPSSYVLWGCVACNSDGSFLIAGRGDARLYLSTDFGVTWNETQPAGNVDRNWSGADCSSDGTYAIVAAQAGRLYTTANSGATWIERIPAGDQTQLWYDVACSDDGSVMVAGVFNGRLYISTDYGVTWVETQPSGNNNQYWYGIDCDADGSVIVAATSYGSLFVSENTGTTWASRPPTITGNRAWRDIAVSGDGQTIIVGNEHDYQATTPRGYAYVTFNAGVTWAIMPVDGSNVHSWEGVAISSSGGRAAMCADKETSTSAGVWMAYREHCVPTWSETKITEYARSLVDDITPAEARTTLELGADSSPTFAGVTLTGLTASRLIASNASNGLISTDLNSWVSGTTNQVIVTDDGDGSITLSTPQDIHTGASPTFAGLIIADGGTIGQAAGPLLTFDDTNDCLGITGCKVGIGILTPDESAGVNVHIYGGSAGTVDAYYGSMLTIENDSFAYINILVPTDSVAGIRFGEGTDSSEAMIYADFDNNHLTLEMESGDIILNPSGSIILSGNVTIPDAGYIGSVSDTDAIQIETDGNIVMSQDLAVSGTLGVTGDITAPNVILADGGALKVSDASPQIVLDNTNGYVEITGNVGINTTTPATTLELYATSPYLTTHNSGGSNANDSRRSEWIARGHKADTSWHNLGLLRFGHDGTGDDQKGMLSIYLNDGDDDAIPQTRAVKITKDKLHFLGNSNNIFEIERTTDSEVSILYRNSGGWWSVGLAANNDFFFYNGHAGESGLALTFTSATKLATFPGSITTDGHYEVSGTQVIGSQGAAVADATDAATAITQLNALLARCRSHGLIAS